MIHFLYVYLIISFTATILAIPTVEAAFKKNRERFWCFVLILLFSPIYLIFCAFEMAFRKNH